MAAPLKILLLTNAELGQANSYLAVYHELLQREDVEVHFASFPEIESRVHEIAEAVTRSSSKGSTGRFHSIDGVSMYPPFAKRKLEAAANHRPGFTGCLEGYADLPLLLCPWEPAAYVEVCDSITLIIQEVNPDLIVIDNLLSPAVDACKKLGRDWMHLSPNTLLDMVRPMLPRMAAFWKYPSTGSGFSFPLSWIHTIANVLLGIRLLAIIIFSSRLKALVKARKSAGYEGLFPTLVPVQDKPYVLPSTRECEYPVVVPPSMHGCGPILLPTPPLQSSSPDLSAWLSRGPTVLIVLGSHFTFTPSRTAHMATAIRLLRASRPEIQVLWKCPPRPGEGPIAPSLASLDADVAADKVRIVTWLGPDPLALLLTGHVACAVNHAGANSWFEAMAAGVPQVNLPSWYDCYDMAARSEWLGIGVWGNRRAAPELDGEELAAALIRVVGGRQGGDAGLRAKAKELAELVGLDGRAKAAAVIVAVAKERKQAAALGGEAKRGKLE